MDLNYIYPKAINYNICNTPELLNMEIDRITSIEKKIINKIQQVLREIEQVNKQDDKIQLNLLIKKLRYYYDKQKIVNEEKRNIMLGLLSKIKKEEKIETNKDSTSENLPYKFYNQNKKETKRQPIHYRMYLKNFYTKRIKK